MSNPRAKAERSKAKDGRQAPAPGKATGGKEKEEACGYAGEVLFLAETRSIYGRYNTIEIAEKVIDQAKRKGWCEPYLA